MSRLRKVRQPNGEIVPFRQQRISRSISEAIRACGSGDAGLADEMAGVVTLFLEKHYDDRNPPDLDDIEEMIHKVLTETGHVKIARAYRRIGSTPRPRSESHDEAARGPLPDVVSHTTRLAAAWDRSRIVSVLCAETRLTEREADGIARSVEDTIRRTGLRRVTTSLVREFVDVELARRGHDGALARHRLLGVAPAQVERWLFPEPDDEVVDPEASCAGAVLEAYGLDELFSRTVARAHQDGRLHIHGLRHPQRVERVVVDATGPLAPTARQSDDFVLELMTLLQALRPLVRSRIVVSRFSEAYAGLGRKSTQRSATRFVRRLIGHLTRDDVYGRAVLPPVTLEVHLTGSHLSDDTDAALAVRHLAQALLAELDRRPALRGRLGLTFTLAASAPYHWPDSSVLDAVLRAARRHRGVGLLLLRDEETAAEGTRHGDPCEVTLDVGAVSVNVPVALALADVHTLDEVTEALEGPVNLAVDALFEKYWFLRRSAPQTLRGIIGNIDGGAELRIDGNEQGASVQLWGLPQALAFLERRGIITVMERPAALAKILSCVDYLTGEERESVRLRTTLGGVGERAVRGRMLEATHRLAVQLHHEELAAALVCIDHDEAALPLVSPLLDDVNRPVLDGGFLDRIGPGLPLPAREGDEVANHLWLRRLFERTRLAYFETELCGEVFEFQEALFVE